MRNPLLLLAAVAAAKADDVDRFAQTQMAKLHIPGMVVGVVRDGKLVRESAYGKADLELNVPMQKADLFEIGSMTKQFTSMAAFMLIGEGKLSLEDPVSKYIPEAPPSWSGVKVRNLLYHTSGLPEYALYDGTRLTDEFTDKQFFASMTPRPVDFTPGETWAYSNTNYALLGWIVQKCAGEPYSKFVTDRILTPLKMTRTVFNSLYDIVPNRSAGYLYLSDKLLRAKQSAASIESDGSLMSCVEDLAKWDAALTDHRFLTPEAYKTMWSPAVLNSGHKRFYGAGWFLPPYSDLAYVGHGGNSSGYSTGIARFLGPKLTVIVMTNLYPVDGEGLAKQIAWIVDPSLRPVPLKPISDPDPSRSAQIGRALADLAALKTDSDLLEPEVTAPLKGSRVTAFGPYAPFKKVEQMLFCSAEPYGPDTLLRYRIVASGKSYDATFLWTLRGRLAHAILVPTIS